MSMCLCIPGEIADWIELAAKMAVAHWLLSWLLRDDRSSGGSSSCCCCFCWCSSESSCSSCSCMFLSDNYDLDTIFGRN